jgi:hypothetical protein
MAQAAATEESGLALDAFVPFVAFVSGSPLDAGAGVMCKVVAAHRIERLGAKTPSRAAIGKPAANTLARPPGRSFGRGLLVCHSETRQLRPGGESVISDSGPDPIGTLVDDSPGTPLFSTTGEA